MHVKDILFDFIRLCVNKLEICHKKYIVAYVQQMISENLFLQKFLKLFNRLFAILQ